MILRRVFAVLIFVCLAAIVVVLLSHRDERLQNQALSLSKAALIEAGIAPSLVIVTTATPPLITCRVSWSLYFNQTVETVKRRLRQEGFHLVPDTSGTTFLRQRDYRIIGPRGGVLGRMNLYRTPAVAIIMDDIGYPNTMALANRLFSLPDPITFSVLPQLNHSLILAEKAAAAGYEVMLHQPMEPEGNANPGPGAITTTMSRDTIIRILRQNLTAVSPMVKGMNNHMGSWATSDTRTMEIVMRELKQWGIYFIDSRTTNHSVAYDMARRFNINTAKRDVFLDNVHDVPYILKQLSLLTKKARKRGTAIGICHPAKATVQALEQWMPTLKPDDMQTALISRILKPW